MPGVFQPASSMAQTMAGELAGGRCASKPVGVTPDIAGAGGHGRIDRLCGDTASAGILSRAERVKSADSGQLSG